jgi:apolipoprotein N-acyltransferase
MAPLLAAIAGGLLMYAAFPPLDWGPLAFVAPIPWLWALRRVERGAGAVALGFIYGFVFFGALLFYVRTVGLVAWLPLTIWLSATAAAYAFLVWAFRHWPPTRWWLVTVGGWALWELIRTRFPFGGFPWGVTGYATAGNPGFVGATQWIGPSGWSVLTIAVAAGIVLLIEQRSQWRLVVDPSVVVLLFALAGGLFPPSPGGEAIQVAIVQGNSPCPMIHCQNENKRIFESHLALTQQIGPGRVDLVVWAENSTGPPFDPVTNSDVRDAITSEARRLDAFLLVSGTRSVSTEEFLNVNMVFDRSGLLIGEYAKRHPVPFGEFVPWRDLLDFIPQLDRVPRDMLRGDDAVVFDLTAGVLGSVISFEGAFPRRIRSEVDAGAQAMVVATNESTWGDAPASDQFLGITRVNAAAFGQDLVHAAITGKSAFIRADGTIDVTTELLVPDVIFGEVRFRTEGRTIYARFGDWLAFMAIVAGIAAFALPGEGRPEPGRRLG